MVTSVVIIGLAGSLLKVTSSSSARNGQGNIYRAPARTIPGIYPITLLRSAWMCKYYGVAFGTVLWEQFEPVSP